MRFGYRVHAESNFRENDCEVVGWRHLVAYAFALMQSRICSGAIRMNRLSNDTRIFFPDDAVKMTTISAETTSPDGSMKRT